MDANQIKNQTLIDDYLKDNLSGIERAKFLSQLESDSELAGELTFMKNMNEALSQNRAERLKEKFINWDKENNSSVVKGKEVKLIPWKKYLAVAASISLLIFLSWSLNSNEKINTLAIFDANFTVYPSEINRNSISDRSMISYSNKDYNIAISLLGESADPSANFFLGNSFLAISEPNKAILALENYTGSKYKLAAQWYLALAHLQNDDLDSSRAVLNKLKLQKGAYGKKANSLLKTIRK